MKHFVRNTAALGAVLMIVGFGMAIGAETMGAEWDHSWYWREPVRAGRGWTEDWEDIPEGVDRGKADGTDSVLFSDTEDISVSLGAGEIIWKTWDGDSIRVTCEDWENLENRYQVYQENGELVVRLRGRNGRNLKAEITVPREYLFSEVDIEVAAGSLQAEDMECVSLDVELAAGNVDLTRCRADEAVFSCAAGEIRYAGSLAGGGEASCTAGSIELVLDQKKTDLNYEIDAAGGMISIDGMEYSGIASRDSVSSGASSSLDLKAAAGSILVEFKGDDV